MVQEVVADARGLRVIYIGCVGDVGLVVYGLSSGLVDQVLGGDITLQPFPILETVGAACEVIATNVVIKTDDTGFAVIVLGWECSNQA
ncbi:MAG: hypothetical protein L6R35_007437, partial [Caloplaca aegaea]